MKRLLTMLLALVLAAGFPVAGTFAYAAAPTAHSFCPGGLTKDELATRIEYSLTLQKDGSRRLEKCWANPNQFLFAFRAGDKENREAGKLERVDQLPAYVRGLREISGERIKSGEYISACVYGKTSGTDDVKLECEQRSLESNERLYGNAWGRATLQGNCANPVLAEVPVLEVEPCYSIVFTPPPGAVAGRIGELAMKKGDGSCKEWKEPGDTEYRSDRPDECPDKLCNFADVVDWYGKPLQEFMSFTPKQGEYTYRVSTYMAEHGMVVICWDVKLPDGRIMRTMGNGVLRENYDAARTAHATDWIVSNREVRPE